ncbi:uncharacterized protein LOC143281995 [Babylonia areolata]|uniref:uncharacterized protein LOC143281995 n=1 Tax=Babylonia areolata TaxID=304850 RepID=UPI003FD39629
MGDNRDSEGVILRDLPLGAAILSDTLSYDGLCQAAMKYHREGENFTLRDSLTDETFVHLIVRKPEIYSRPDRVGFLYLLSCKAIDLDAKDCTGDTALHKVVRQRGTHRMISCLLRCGADPLVKNSAGKTAEQILRTERPDGWEENLHWLQKFLPGLFHAVLTDEPDMQLVERLLKSWCRLCKVINGEVRWLKCLAHKRACSLRVIMLLEKYENTIELALAALAGKTLIIQNWRKEDIMKNMDINARDSSYQYGYPDYPSCPRPLLAGVWETNNYDMVAELMKMEPDLSVPFRFEPEAHHKAKPLFFYVIDPKMKPEDERIIRRVLQDSDLSARNTLGQTVLFEAVQHTVSQALFSFMLSQGCDVAARDRYGRTARDYSQELDKEQYVALIDQHVSSLVHDCNIRCLESLVLRGYDHITDLEVVRKGRSGDLRVSKDSRQLEELLADVGKKQEYVKKMFESIKSTATLCPRKFLTKKYVTAQDKGGRTVLHHAIEQGRRKLVETIVKEFAQIINVPNNMGQTPLHYAYLFMYTDDTADYLISKGACTDFKDVEGWMPTDYVRKSIGVHAHEQMQQRVRDLELDLFLSATNFDVSFLQAIRDGDKKHVEALAIRLRDHGGMRRFNSALFECIDSGNEDIAYILIKLGFSTEVYKQYEMCQPDDPMCAMMECSHAMTSFQQRAEQVDAKKVLQLMSDIAKGKVKLKGRGCCMGRCIRPSLPGARLAQS